MSVVEDSSLPTTTGLRQRKRCQIRLMRVHRHGLPPRPSQHLHFAYRRA